MTRLDAVLRGLSLFTFSASAKSAGDGATTPAKNPHWRLGRYAPRWTVFSTGRFLVKCWFSLQGRKGSPDVVEYSALRAARDARRTDRSGLHSLQKL